MKNKIVILLLVMVVSGIFAFAGFSDAKLVFEDKRLDINSAERDDFSFPAIAEGEAYIISGPFAELEEKNTVYGIPVGKKSTYYYLVSNTDYETFSDIIMSDTDNIFGEMTWYIASVSDEDLVEKFDSAALKMDRWMQNYSNLVSLFEKSGYDDELDAQKVENLLEYLMKFPVEYQFIAMSDIRRNAKAFLKAALCQNFILWSNRNKQYLED